MNYCVRRSRIGQCLIILIAIAGSITTFAITQQAAAQEQVSASLAFVSPVVVAQAEDEAANAAPVQKRGISFLTLLTQGGWFMIPLLALSLAVVTIAIERFLALRRSKIFPPELIDQISMLSQSPGGLDPRRVYQACQRYPSCASYVLRSTLVLSLIHI